MKRLYDEIHELHPSFAKWLQRKKWIYDYEYWLDAHSRVDFVAFDILNDKRYMIEIGNHFANDFELVDKILQCERYKAIYPSYKMILALPNNYNEHNDILNYLCKYYEIKIIKFKVGDYISNYKRFQKIIFRDYPDLYEINKSKFQ